MISACACLPSIIATLLEGQPLSQAKVAFAWRVAVGPAVDRATKVTLTTGGTLEVSTAAVAWRSEIERSLGLILPRVRAILGPDVVRTIRVT